MTKLLWMIPLLPLMGALVNGLLGGVFRRKAIAFLGVGVVAVSFLLALKALVLMKAAPGMRLELTGPLWMSAGPLSVSFGLVFDPLSTTMALMVAGISLLIHLYSVGYMWEDKGFARYFAYLNLFVFFMLTLVLGSSLPVLFVGWEGVGLCSYLLIGYYHETEHAPAAGLKAFLFNRVGDTGMVIGMMTLFGVFGTLDVGPILQAVGKLAPDAGFGLITFATLMLFVGATGKSAQIPLYLWLPDAMAGPTPVSALIHAATMVTAGIFLVCRLAPLFQMAPITLNVIAIVGAATALFAATMGLCQRDIKKVLAYSTISQLGYMFLGLGAAGFAAGFSHVFTHAWFKALLFLGAGSVIHAMGNGAPSASASHEREDGTQAPSVVPEQDLFNMGGLRKKLPITFWTMAIATLAIIGVPPFAGFFSKDEILYLAYMKHPLLWIAGVLGTCFTAFYMARLMTLAFFGEPRNAHHAFLSPRAASEAENEIGHSPIHSSPQTDRALSTALAEHGEHSPIHPSSQTDRAASPEADGGGEHGELIGHDPIHESPWTMTLPLAILAVGSAVAGFWGVPAAFGGHFAIGSWLSSSLTYGQAPIEHLVHHGPAVLLAVVSTSLVLASAAYGYFSYRGGLGVAKARAGAWPSLHRWVEHTYFVDEFLEGYILPFFRWLSNVLWKLIDVILIDGVCINLPARLTQVAGDFVALLQTGRVRNYTLAMALGAVGLLWFFLR